MGAKLVPRLLEASAGNEFRFRVAAVLNESSEGKVSDEVRAVLHELLTTVSTDLKTD